MVGGCRERFLKGAGIVGMSLAAQLLGENCVVLIKCTFTGFCVTFLFSSGSRLARPLSCGEVSWFLKTQTTSVAKRIYGPFRITAIM
jgi:hypothetical protein